MTAVQRFTGKVECPECAEEIELKDVMSNEIVQCPTCGEDWEVRGLDPVVLEPAPKTQEDYGE